MCRGGLWLKSQLLLLNSPSLFLSRFLDKLLLSSQHDTSHFYPAQRLDWNGSFFLVKVADSGCPHSGYALLPKQITVMRERNHDPTAVVVEWAPWPTVCSQFLSAENSSLITEMQRPKHLKSTQLAPR